ncbi:hypothetical protein ABEX55_04410 [Priestia endophytica]|uniref:hypothetical protein n=1 Tax=Priestia endophytica TaxID=135735 RepID=UPI003D278C2F
MTNKKNQVTATHRLINRLKDYGFLVNPMFSQIRVCNSYLWELLLVNKPPLFVLYEKVQAYSRERA